MLAAKSNYDDNLELLKLTLFLVNRGEANVPPVLKEHVIAVIRQAQLLLQFPTVNIQNPSPESIELALEIQSHDDLVNDFRGISDFDSIDPMLASRLLDKMEHKSVC
ncbi:MAG: hypothetical protein HY272_02185 [Gammaproteobacteria bacterium]|nr:hypothetical protein [Gammaproteobacteria bacterium]